MQQFRTFIGVDVSKQTLDWARVDAHLQPVEAGQLTNSRSAISEWIDQLRQSGLHLSELLVCVEQTGYYSAMVVRLLREADLAVWAASSLQIYLARGLQRGKTDPVDAERIACYACRYQDKVRLDEERSQAGQRLQQLLSQRRRLVVDRAGYKAQLRELPPFMDEEAGRLMNQNLETLLATLDEAISQLEAAIRRLIRQVQHFAQQYRWLTSIDGVGPVLAWTVLGTTDGFTRFKGPRSFACHAGVAPFADSSGTRTKPPHVSPLANKRLKSLLHMAALVAVRKSGELQTYYQRKVTEGKPKMSVLNAVRNKIVHRMYAVVKHQRPYQSEPLMA